ncbi:DUF7824 domain-containing protein [Streptomyces hebeiensis]
MSALLDAVREGRVRDVPGLVKPLDAAERKAELAELKALRTEVRSWGWDRWQGRTRTLDALIVAGAGCLTGAAATVSWITARDLRDGDRTPVCELVDLLAGREPGWLGDVAHRLAARASTAELDYPLIESLVGLARCAMPTTEPVVRGWVTAIGHRHALRHNLLGNRHTPVMVPRLFEAAATPAPLLWYDDPEDPGQWPQALVAVVEAGVVERPVVVTGCVERLLRTGRPSELKFFLGLLGALDLTEGERREHIADWIGMAADAASPVAGYAQGVLSELALSGALPLRALADMSASVLFRPEKKLVRAQLVLLGKVLRAEPGAAGDLLPVVAEAFGHEDTTVQERALKLVARHLPHVDRVLHEELAGHAGLLSPVHRDLAVAAFGELSASAASGAYEEILPPVPTPVPMAPAPSDLAELVEDVTALITSGRGNVGTDWSPPLGTAEFERTLDGVVRHAHRDRTALAEGLRETFARFPSLLPVGGHGDAQFRPTGFITVAAAVLGEAPTGSQQSLEPSVERPACGHQALRNVLLARLREAAGRLARAESLPFLLATPTWLTGTLDADVLVDRLAEYHRLGVDAGPLDFAQALIRLPRGADPAAARAAATLGTPEGDRLAAWLLGDGVTAGSAVGARPPSDGQEPDGQEPGGHRAFPQPLAWLSRPKPDRWMPCYDRRIPEDALWLSVLPQDRDVLAGWLEAETRNALKEVGRTAGAATWLLSAAERDGPAGPALHRALACALVVPRAEDRLAAVDALLVLAARGDLNGRSLGGELAGLLIEGQGKANRLTDSLRTAAATGAYRTVWSVLRAALPELLPPVTGAPRRPEAPGTRTATPPDAAPPDAAGSDAAGSDGASPGRSARHGAIRTGLGELLAVAADCVERCRDGGVPPGLAEFAGHGGSSQAVRQAGRLLTALRTGGDHSTP